MEKVIEYNNLISHHFPISVDTQRACIKNIMKFVTLEELAWISQNRDFAETERYTVKGDVDKSLDSSEVIKKERKIIEQLFQNNDSIKAAEIYSKMLMSNLTNLNKYYIEKFGDEFEFNLDYCRQAWKELKVISDIDNAHAMYLSSDNWSFSVFHKIIEEMETIIGLGSNEFNVILTAGIQDVRTFSYNTLSGDYYNQSREDFISNIIKNGDYIRSNGIVPLVTFKIATKKKEFTINELEVFSRYEDTKARLMDRLDADKRRALNDLLIAYQTLYSLRTVYDVYEYFGFYAFIRHAFILKTYKCIKKYCGNEIAQKFHYLASTYQFAEIPEF